MYLKQICIRVNFYNLDLIVFAECNQQDAKLLIYFYFCKMLYMFQTVFPSIIRSSKLHIQRQIFVRPILLPAVSGR